MKKYLFALLIAAFAFAGSSQAASINFVIGNDSTVSVDDSGFWGSSVTAALSSGLSGLAFNLAPGESKTFDFFEITIGKCLVCGGSASVDATLDFSAPNASASGSGWGKAVSVVGMLTLGALEWVTQPGLISTSAGDFIVTFLDLKGITLGKSATVQARVEAVSAVPLPAAGWLFGSALLALAGWRRRSQR